MYDSNVLFNHKMYDSMAFRLFGEWHNYYYSQFYDIHIIPKGAFYSLASICSLLPQAKITTNLFALWICLLDVSFNWNHMKWDPLWLPFSLSMMFSRLIHFVHCISTSSIFLLSRDISLYGYAPFYLFILLLMAIWVIFTI